MTVFTIITVLLSKIIKMEQSALNFIYFLAAIGGIAFIFFAARILWSFIKVLIPSKNIRERFGPKTWAVITGGSDGIGLGFCQQLAEQGFNICIIARNQQKMEGVLDKLKQIYPKMEGRTVVADFMKCQEQNFFKNIMNQIQDLDVSVLVNNVGVTNMGYLTEISEQKLMGEININCVSGTMMSYMLIPKMLLRQRRSAIINVSSIAGSYPVPYMATYSATKAFNDFFSQSIEMQFNHKIDIISSKPFKVQTNLSKASSSTWNVATKNQCARATLKDLGLNYQTNGWWLHCFMGFVTECLPTIVLRYITESQSRQTMQKLKKQEGAGQA